MNKCYLRIARVSMTRLWALIISIGVLAVLLTGCGGGDNSNPRVATLKTLQDSITSMEHQINSNYADSVATDKETLSELELIRADLQEIKELMRSK